MNADKLIENMRDQIKEAQIKLGYVKETVNLYYPVSSLNALTGLHEKSAEELAGILESEPAFSKTLLGSLKFSVHKGRIEVRIPPEGSEYVRYKVESPAFLTDMIKLFSEHHSCKLPDICAVFARYSSDYVCEKMPDGMDFDYVLYFRDTRIDAYYYCVKEEMGHTIYHRFTKEDYQELLK